MFEPGQIVVVDAWFANGWWYSQCLPAYGKTVTTAFLIVEVKEMTQWRLEFVTDKGNLILYISDFSKAEIIT